MNVESEDYLDTYSPVVAELYLQAVEDYFQLDALEGKGIDEWIYEYGREMIGEQKELLTKFRIVLRSFWSKNSGGVIFMLPSDSKEAMLDFLKNVGGTNIVTITGKSIIGMSRKNISLHGSEFYVMMKSDTLEPMIEYSPKKEQILKTFTTVFLSNITKKIAKELSKKKTKKDMVEFYNKAHSELKKWVKSSMKKSTVYQKNKETKKKNKYNLPIIMRMLYSDSQERKNMNYRQYEKELKERFGDIFGKELFAWLKSIDDPWKEFHDTYPNATEKMERAFLQHHVEKTILENHPNLYADIIGISCQGAMIAQGIGSRIDDYAETIEEDLIKRKEEEEEEKRKALEIKKAKKVNTRKNIFSYMGAAMGEEFHSSNNSDFACAYCESSSCEHKKEGLASGLILKCENDTIHCPKELFDVKMKGDKVFNKGVAGMISRSEKLEWENCDPKVVCIGSRSENFNARKHYLLYNSIKNGQVKSHDKTSYTFSNESNEVNVNNAMKQQNFQCVEYKHPQLDHVLFLLEV